MQHRHHDGPGQRQDDQGRPGAQRQRDPCEPGAGVVRQGRGQRAEQAAAPPGLGGPGQAVVEGAGQQQPQQRQPQRNQLAWLAEIEDAEVEQEAVQRTACEEHAEQQFAFGGPAADPEQMHRDDRGHGQQPEAVAGEHADQPAELEQKGIGKQAGHRRVPGVRSGRAV